MKKLYIYLLIILTGIFCISACSDKDDGELYIDEYRKVNEWIYQNMSEWYLWNDKIPKNTNYMLSPDKYFKTLLYKEGRVDGDRFSWIQNNFLELINSLSGVNKEAGYDFTLLKISKDSKNLFGVITYIKPNSPAETAGLNRGNFFIKVNNKQLTEDNYKSLLGQLNANHTLGLGKVQGGTIVGTIDKSLNVVEYHENPIFYTNTYTVGNKKVGYLVYNFFSGDDGDGSLKYDKALNNIFGEFKQNNIDELILDLRYNGGGAVSSAIHLASMIVPGLDANKVFARNKFNPIIEKALLATDPNALFYNFTTNIERTNSKNQVIESTPINNLGLPDIHILTSFRTASASELIINSLSPYMNVVMIGDSTTGKNVASISIYERNNPLNKWGMQPIVMKIANCNGFADFEKGFAADVKFSEYDFILDFYSLGDPKELMLSTTLEYIATGNKPKAAVKAMGVSKFPIDTHNKGMYVDMKILPSISK